MFAFMRKLFGYCEPSAQLRINALRLMTDVPKVEAKISTGDISLTVAANIQSFLYAEKKSNRPYSQEAKLELIETCMNKSVREVQQEFVSRNPEIEKREVVRQTSDDRVRVSHSISTDLEAKLQRIKDLWSNVDPTMSRETLLDRMAEITLDKIDPVRKAHRAAVRNRAQPADDCVTQAASASENSLHAHEVKRSRYIAADVKRAAFTKNSGQGCAFVSEATGQRCGSTFQLQVDHVEPYSKGGGHEPENLRLLCAQHNRWVWQHQQRFEM